MACGGTALLTFTLPTFLINLLPPSSGRKVVSVSVLFFNFNSVRVRGIKVVSYILKKFKFSCFCPGDGCNYQFFPKTRVTTYGTTWRYYQAEHSPTLCVEPKYQDVSTFGSFGVTTWWREDSMTFTACYFRSE
jgi:hypothetical protein